MNTDIVLNGRTLKVDNNNLVSLTDIWKASGLSTSYEPIQWSKTKDARRFINHIKQWSKTKDAKRFINNINEKEKPEDIQVFYRKRGRNGGTFGHWQIALAYAQWLSPEFKAKVQDIFRRHEIGDPKLAEDVLDNQYKRGNFSDPKTNKRVEGKASRNYFTEIIRLHGVDGQGFAIITDTVYLSLFNKKARSLRKEKGLPANPSKTPATRDSMDIEELTAVKMSEDLAALRIERQGAIGVNECKEITEDASNEVKNLIDK